MQYDRQITITTGANRRATKWRPQTLKLSELYARLSTPTRSVETIAEYLAMPKGKQDDLKLEQLKTALQRRNPHESDLS